jgi:hypothetical protein
MLSPVVAPLSLKKKVLIGSLVGLAVVGVVVGVVVGMSGGSSGNISKSGSSGDNGAAVIDDSVEYGVDAPVCYWSDGVLSIHVDDVVGCTIRTDTFEVLIPVDGYVSVQDTFDASLELYNQVNSRGDCSDFITEIVC